MITRKKEEEFLPSHGELMKMLVGVGMQGKGSYTRGQAVHFHEREREREIDHRVEPELRRQCRVCYLQGRSTLLHCLRHQLQGPTQAFLLKDFEKKVTVTTRALR